MRPLVLPRTEGARQWKELDGIRALALIIVSLYHLFVVTRPTWNPLKPSGGYLGVDIFFVLSGFLITSLLLGELNRNGRIDLKAFWSRRGLRILPALLVLLLGVGIALLVLHGEDWEHPTRLGFLWVLFYVGNWNSALYGGRAPLGALGHTWSLSVEEQFYLLWPIVFVLVTRRFHDRRKVAYGLAAATAAEWLYRFVAVKDHWALGRIYFSTDLHSDGLVLGCALAFWVASRHDRPLTHAQGRALDAATLASIVVMAAMIQREGLFVRASGAWAAIPLAGVCTAVVVADMVLHPQPAVSAFLRLRPLGWLGLRSYSMYLWVTAIEDMMHGMWVHQIGLYGYNALLIAMGLVAATISYRFVEMPFLRLKKRFNRAPITAATEDQAMASTGGHGPLVTEPG